MQIPEMKVITKTNAHDDNLYERCNSFFDPYNEDAKRHHYHNVLLSEHFKNVVISNVCELFDNNISVRELIPVMNDLSINQVYEAVYISWCECYYDGGTSYVYAHTATEILCESICTILLAHYSTIIIDKYRSDILNAIYRALPDKYFGN